MSDDPPHADRPEADRRPDDERPDDERPDDERPDDERPDDAGRRLEALLAEHRDPTEQEPDVTVERELDPFAPVPGAVATDPTAATDDDGGGPDDADHLPEAPLFALLRNVQEDVGLDRIDRIWIFPPRRQGAGETSVVVVAAFHDSDPDRRRVYAAHYTAHTDATEPRLALDEFGTAPSDRVGRLVEEVLERIKDGPAGAPRSYDIGGRDEHWHHVLHLLAEAHLEEARRDARLRP